MGNRIQKVSTAQPVPSPDAGNCAAPVARAVLFSEEVYRAGFHRWKPWLCRLDPRWKLHKSADSLSLLSIGYEGLRRFRIRAGQNRVFPAVSPKPAANPAARHPLTLAVPA